MISGSRFSAGKAFQQSVLATHLVKQPLDFLLFSDFAVIVAYVHILTMMMVVDREFHGKIDHGLIAAARDAGASETQIVRDIVIRCRRGHHAGLRAGC